MITSPPGTMGKLSDAPPVIQPNTGTYHVYELAAAQQKDPIISWFVQEVMRQVERGEHAKVKESPDMHPEARQMLRMRLVFKD